MQAPGLTMAAILRASGRPSATVETREANPGDQTPVSVPVPIDAGEVVRHHGIVCYDILIHYHNEPLNFRIGKPIPAGPGMKPNEHLRSIGIEGL